MILLDLSGLIFLNYLQVTCLLSMFVYELPIVI
jgi:hypothetical protein